MIKQSLHEHCMQYYSSFMHCKFRDKVCEESKGDIMSSEQEKRAELDARGRQGETVVPGGTRGKGLEAQERLAEGRSRGGETRRELIGIEGYHEMGRKGGLSTTDMSGGERAAEEGVEIDESKYKTRST